MRFSLVPVHNNSVTSIPEVHLDLTCLTDMSRPLSRAIHEGVAYVGANPEKTEACYSVEARDTTAARAPDARGRCGTVRLPISSVIHRMPPPNAASVTL
jgi:hypothetical protein